jgi:hypothetical protein
MDGVMNAWGVQTGRQRYSVDWNWKARPSFAKVDAQHHKNQCNLLSTPKLSHEKTRF